ncbi:MAG: FGGY family carbohydrate kinase [Anaerovoracaceae bacterium]
MSRERILAGFDVGTSSLKVTLADVDTGMIKDDRNYSYLGFHELAPGVVPVSVYEDTIRHALGEICYDYDLMGMALTTQMYSICGKVGGKLFSYQWNSLWDRMPEIESKIYAFLMKSGCQVDTLFPGYKLATLPDHVREEFVPYGLKEHLIQFLTGRLVTDYTTASASGVFDVERRIWNKEFVQFLGMDEAKLPDTAPHDEVIGMIRTSLSSDIKSPIPLVPGLGDGPSASLSCRQISNYCGNLGTSMAARVFTQVPGHPHEHGLWNFAVDKNTHVVGGISSNSCSVLHWAGDMGISIEKDLPNTKEVMFFPWVHGERMPFWSSDLRGTFIGLRKDDSPKVLQGAVIKAIAFTFVRMAKVLEAYVEEGKPLVLAGGGTNVNSILNIIASCLGTDIVMLENAEYLCSTGALMSAGKGTGINVFPEFKVDSILSHSDENVEEFGRWAMMADRVATIYR